MQSHFREKAILLSLEIEGKIRTLKEELHYYSEILKAWVIVEVDFKTDLGSIPALLQGLIPKDGKGAFPYIVHDKLYRQGKYSQKICDDVLKEACKVTGVSWWRRVSIRGGLRVGGFVAYNRHRKNDKKEIR